MIAPLRKSLTVGACALFVAFTLPHASAQTVTATVGKLTSDALLSPQFSVRGTEKGGFKPKEWLEIETSVNLTMNPEPKSMTCDRLTIKWYVVVKDTERSGRFLLLTRDVEHVNIPVKDDVYCSVYLSPASVRRLTGGDRASSRMVERVGYEILVNGVKVAQESSKGDPGWWNAASEKISRSDAVPLLSKNETPFAHLWWDRYAEVSESRGR